MNIKKSVMQVLMIAVLVVGMVVALILINTNTRKDETAYIPEHNPEEIGGDSGITLDGYSKLNVYDCEIPLSVDVISTTLYFDSATSYAEYEIDSLSVQLGDIVSANDVIGYENENPVCTQKTGLVVFFKDGKVTVKSFSDVYAKFSKSIYDSYLPKIGDEYTVVFGLKEVCKASVVYGDYMNPSDDKIEFTVKIDNSDLYFQTEANVSLIKCGITRSCKCVSAEELNITERVFENVNKYKTVLFIKDGNVENVDLYLTVNYLGNCCIDKITNEYGDIVDLSGGELYVSTN